MSRRQVGQAVLAVRTPGAAGKMDDRRSSDTEFLEAELAPAKVTEAEGWSRRAGPQRSIGDGRHLHCDRRYPVCVQFRWE